MNEPCLRTGPVFLFCLILFFSQVPACALEPEEVLVIANTNAAKSKGLAQYYMKKRQIPEKNLVLLFMTEKETCSREEYEKKAIPPIRRFLDQHEGIRALVTVFGIPLIISAPEKTLAETSRISELEARKKILEEDLAEEKKLDNDLKQKKNEELSELKNALAEYLKNIDKVAAFDSELTLVKKDRYDLNMWQPNPYYLGFRGRKLPIAQSEVLITGRLDGATEIIVKRIIDDSIEAEKTGLKGKAYFDARWKYPEDKTVAGYAFYDRSIHQASRTLAKKKRIEVVINDSESLFQKGESPDTALYCGWYSLARYIDAFAWQKGSVGYHIASSECATLKNPDSQVWCKKMLDNGIAATVGPVSEPYVQAFPVPEIFFNFLMEGYLTLSESYLVSLPYLSWKMVLIGDPLYRLNLNP
ncbi:MAG: TIGR03790 family protein [Desulfobacterales bacterium RIFOXYA12_FULL_46_15]|nr:MAG: TIGR03790 family protein [Desulfobacula sp. GWF2_41_7]OGR22591.1 MAG: TIGR03790 family protein [Desulfobacterales bacterium RIFOXYA12_FULL_46_15]